MVRRFLALLICFVPVLATASPEEAARKTPDVRLLDTKGYSHQLGRYSDMAAIAVIAWDAERPEAAQAAQEVSALFKDFQAAKVQFFLLDPAPRGNAAAEATQIAVAQPENAALLAGASSKTQDIHSDSPRTASGQPSSAARMLPSRS